MNIEIVISKKAKQIIDKLSTNEGTFLKVALSYISEDMKHINQCSKEIKYHSSTNYSISDYQKAIKKQTELIIRTQYLLQCINLYVYDNHENNTIEVKAYNDK
jgi:hypothetical protein